MINLEGCPHYGVGYFKGSCDRHPTFGKRFSLPVGSHLGSTRRPIDMGCDRHLGVSGEWVEGGEWSVYIGQIERGWNRWGSLTLDRIGAA